MGGIVCALLHVHLNAVCIRALVAAALAVCLIPIGTTQADPLWPRYESWGWGDSKPFQQKHRPAHRKHELAAPTADAAARQERSPPTTEAAPREAGEPIMAIVSISSQQITFYDAEGWILRAPVSTGHHRTRNARWHLRRHREGQGPPLDPL